MEAGLGAWSACRRARSARILIPDPGSSRLLPDPWKLREDKLALSYTKFMGILTLLYTIAQVSLNPELQKGFGQLACVISGAAEISGGAIVPLAVPARLLACVSHDCHDWLYLEVQGPGGQPIERGGQAPREATVSRRRDGSAAA